MDKSDKSKRCITLSYLSVKDAKVFYEQDLIFIKVLEGSVLIRNNNNPQVLIKNDLIAIHKETCFVLSPTEEHNMVTFLRLDVMLCRTYEKGVGLRVYSANSALYEAQFPKLYQILRHELVAITRCDIFENKKILHRHLKQLFHLLINHFNYVTCGHSHKIFNDKIKIRYIEIYKNYFKLSNKKSLLEISEEMNVNYDYLRKDIKNRFGFTFHQLKDNRRVNIAVKYILETDLTLSEIGEKTGFSDYKYMVDRFKKRYMLTPFELKKICRNDVKAVMNYAKIL